MEIKFYNIEEKDTDLAIIRSFIDYESVRELFFSQIKRRGEIVKIYHSLTQQESDGHEGESDIVIICDDGKNKFAIFIEDKINADPQPFQRKRYDDRAKLLAKQEGFDKPYVFLCAPMAYLSTGKADGYDFLVSHESIYELLAENDLNKWVFAFSCDEKKQGYVVNKNDAVTDFWDNLYKYLDDNYSNVLTYNKNNKPRGSKADWPIFKTSVKGLSIIWKSTPKFNRVDLEFAGFKNKKEAFIDLVKRVGADNYEPVETTGSMALTIRFLDSENVSFHKPFYEQIENIKKFLDAAVEFKKLTDKMFFLNITDVSNY